MSNGKCCPVCGATKWSSDVRDPITKQTFCGDCFEVSRYLARKKGELYTDTDNKTLKCADESRFFRFLRNARYCLLGKQ